MAGGRELSRSRKGPSATVSQKPGTSKKKRGKERGRKRKRTIVCLKTPSKKKIFPTVLRKKRNSGKREEKKKPFRTRSRRRFQEGKAFSREKKRGFRKKTVCLDRGKNRGNSRPAGSGAASNASSKRGGSEASGKGKKKRKEKTTVPKLRREVRRFEEKKTPFQFRARVTGTRVEKRKTKRRGRDRVEEEPRPLPSPPPPLRAKKRWASMEKGVRHRSQGEISVTPRKGLHPPSWGGTRKKERRNVQRKKRFEGTGEEKW